MKYLFICLSFIMATACNQRSIKGDGNRITEIRDVSDFEKIKLTSSITVILKKGPSQKVEVESDGNIIDLIETKVDGNTLKITYKNGFNIIKAKSTVSVTTPNLSGIHISGSGNVTSNDVVESGSDLDLNISGSGKIDIPVDAPEVDVKITGSGDIKLDGVTRDIKYVGTGSGSLHAKDLKAEAADIKITGSGDAHVFASLTLEAKITGSGNVTYAGSPIVESKITGSGKVRAAH